MSSVRYDQRPEALIWVAAGASLWGCDTILRRPLTSHFSSATIVLAEHLTLLLILLPVLWIRRADWMKLRWIEWAAVLAIAWGGSALGTILFTEAVRLGNPTVAVLLQKSQPMFAALLAALVLSEPLGMSFWTRLAIALSGAYLINFGAQIPNTRMALLSSLCALGAAALWGSSTVMGRFVLGKVSFVTLTALRIAVAVPLLAGIAFVQPQDWTHSISRQDIVSVILMALIPGFAGLMVYYRGLAHSYASRAAVAELFFPCTALVLNWIWFGIGITLEQAGGFVLLVWAILGWERERRRTTGSENQGAETYDSQEEQPEVAGK